jgi:hypothetical protein
MYTAEMWFSSVVKEQHIMLTRTGFFPAISRYFPLKPQQQPGVSPTPLCRKVKNMMLDYDSEVSHYAHITMQ